MTDHRETITRLRDEMAARAREHRSPLAKAAGCQCDPAWHADELEKWVADLDVLLRASRAPAQDCPQWVVDALNGLIGLIQLLPDEQRRDLIASHRYLDALTASNRLAAPRDAEDARPLDPQESPAHQLGRLLQEAGAQVQIGLRAQGHYATVQHMRDEDASWDEIGAAIGWHGPAVERWFEMEQQLASARQEATPTPKEQRRW